MRQYTVFMFFFLAYFTLYKDYVLSYLSICPSTQPSIHQSIFLAHSLAASIYWVSDIRHTLLIPNFIINVSVQFSSVAQSCPTLCDPMNHSMPGLPVKANFLHAISMGGAQFRIFGYTCCLALNYLICTWCDFCSAQHFQVHSILYLIGIRKFLVYRWKNNIKIKYKNPRLKM